MMHKLLIGLGITNLLLAAWIKDTSCVWVGLGCLGLAFGGIWLEKVTRTR